MRYVSAVLQVLLIAVIIQLKLRNLTRE